MSEITPFTVEISDTALEDLHRRLRDARWPDQLPDAGWDYGAEMGYIQELARYWTDEYDWRAAEAELNELDHFTTAIDGQNIHFIHQRSPHPDAYPLVISHGWPGSVVEFLDMIGPADRARRPRRCLPRSRPLPAGIRVLGADCRPGMGHCPHRQGVRRADGAVGIRSVRGPGGRLGLDDLAEHRTP